MCLNLSKSNLDPCNITEVYKPNLAAGENARKGISTFFVLALEAGGRYYLSGYQTLVSEVMATSSPLNLLWGTGRRWSVYILQPHTQSVTLPSWECSTE